MAETGQTINILLWNWYSIDTTSHHDELPLSTNLFYRKLSCIMACSIFVHLLRFMPAYFQITYIHLIDEDDGGIWITI